MSPRDRVLHTKTLSRFCSNARGCRKEQTLLSQFQKNGENIEVFYGKKNKLPVGVDILGDPFQRKTHICI